MSSDLLSFDRSFYTSSEFASPEADLHFFSDALSPFSDILEIPPVDELIQQNQAEKPQFLDQTVPHYPTNFSSSPPSHKMGNLTLSQTNTTTTTTTPHLQPFTNCSNGFVDFSGLEMNTQVVGLGYSYNSTFLPQNFSVSQNVAQILQRSCSSKSFREESGFFHQPRLDFVMQSPKFQTHLENSPENAFFSARMRRVCSTGDLQEMRPPQMTHKSFLERSFVDEANFKVGRYSADERRERIHKYRAKRSQRNFNKTIKYACRKALADNRPRIRGRFARNDEIGETPNTAILIKDEDEDDLWVDGFHGEVYEGTVRGGGQFLNNFGPTQFQYYGH